MDYQPKPQFEESALRERCTADCSRCPTFPAPFRRIGDASYCRFTRIEFDAGEGVRFPSDGKVYVLFVLSGSLMLEKPEQPARLVTSKQCVCLERDAVCQVTAQDGGTCVVVLSLLHHMEFCEQDIFGEGPLPGTAIPAVQMPVLMLHPVVEQLLSSFFLVHGMADCERYHKMKTAELFMLIKVLYTPTEQACFFQSMILPQDNFRVFVSNNHERARSVAELAAMAGMSLSAFKRRFAACFNDSVYHWMMEQKAHRILADIRDGEGSTKALMQKYGFRYYTQFSRFCKNYLRATPAQLIARVRERQGGTAGEL